MLKEQVVYRCTVAQDQQLRCYLLPEARVAVPQIVAEGDYIFHRSSQILGNIYKTVLNPPCTMRHKVTNIGVIPVLQDKFGYRTATMAL